MADLTKSLRTLKKTDVKKIPGSLGLTQTVVDVPGRAGFSFVRLLGNTSELIQAFNTVVASVYDLPVIVQWDGTKYVIIGRDINRYNTWGSSPYLPIHGPSHQWNGGDPIWIFSEQFYPFSVTPSGSSVYIAPYTYNWNGSWVNGGGVYFPGITLPTGTSTQKIMLLYIDGPTATPTWLLGGEAPLYTQKELLVPYLPTFNQSVGIPLAMARIPSGTSSWDWSLLYDVRQWFMDGTSGSSGGGGGISEAPIDGNPYSRENAGWVASSTGLADAPSNGSLYGRKNAAWSVVTGSSSGISDAPSDGTLYGRKNAAWSAVTGSSGGVSRSGNTGDGELVIWNGVNANSIKDGSTLRVNIYQLSSDTLNSLLLNANGVIDANAYGAGNGLLFKAHQAGGTRVSPTKSAINEPVMDIYGGGYDGSNFQNSADIYLYTDEAWDSGKLGTRWEVWATLKGQASESLAFVIYANRVNVPAGSSYDVNDVARIKGDGSFSPPSLADASASNNSIYFSTNANKLVYKDAGGTVNALY